MGQGTIDDAGELAAEQLEMMPELCGWGTGDDAGDLVAGELEMTPET